MATQLQEAREHERLFLMHVSHELRTPLTAIRGHVAALADGIVESPDEQGAAFDVIAAEASRLERLIGDLLDLAKLEADRFTFRRERGRRGRPAGALRGDAPRDGARRATSTSSCGRPTSARWRATATGSCRSSRNLVENAVRWTPAGGIVRLSRRPRDGRRAHRGGRLGARACRCDRRADVFSPFFSEGGGGTGLGLAIASELATRDGRLAVRRRRARGRRAVRLRAPARLRGGAADARARLVTVRAQDVTRRH